ncbi:MAG TPA: helicase HerA-like domain-containing protein, partial [Angustibacter sp.]|nr:helicase HerA-like domain-containing protein [Angustibacter sp.]
MAETASDQLEQIRAGYGVSGPALEFGAAVSDGTAHADAPVRIPLASLNRHGLVAGATGTGKTKTLQVMAEQLSAQGVPVFLADIKGDLSGIATPGVGNDKI